MSRVERAEVGNSHRLKKIIQNITRDEAHPGGELAKLRPHQKTKPWCTTLHRDIHTQAKFLGFYVGVCLCVNFKSKPKCVLIFNISVETASHQGSCFQAYARPRTVQAFLDGLHAC